MFTLDMPIKLAKNTKMSKNKTILKKLSIEQFEFINLTGVWGRPNTS